MIERYNVKAKKRKKMNIWIFIKRKEKKSVLITHICYSI
jgi:hypothetical protein